MLNLPGDVGIFRGCDRVPWKRVQESGSFPQSVHRYREQHSARKGNSKQSDERSFPRSHGLYYYYC